MSQRLLRVRELLKREIGAVVKRDFEFRDCLITITDVDVSPDLKNANVFVGALGGGGFAGKNAVEKLNRNRAAIQRKVYSRVVLKSSARLTFKLDHSVERGVGVVALLDEIESSMPAEAPDDVNPDLALGGEEE